MSHKHTFPVGEIQHKVAEFCYCFSVYNRTHSFNFPFVAQKSTRVAQVLEKYGLDAQICIPATLDSSKRT